MAVLRKIKGCVTGKISRCTSEAESMIFCGPLLNSVRLVKWEQELGSAPRAAFFSWRDVDIVSEVVRWTMSRTSTTGDLRWALTWILESPRHVLCSASGVIGTLWFPKKLQQTKILLTKKSRSYRRRNGAIFLCIIITSVRFAMTKPFEWKCLEFAALFKTLSKCFYVPITEWFEGGQFSDTGAVIGATSYMHFSGNLIVAKNRWNPDLTFKFDLKFKWQKLI